MSEYRAITITQGSGGFGGPLTVEPKEGKDVLLYITGGGAEPDILPKIVELTGCRPVNGFKTSVPVEENSNDQYQPSWKIWTNGKIYHRRYLCIWC